MKILIVNGYVRENKGDASIMSVLSHQLQDIFPDADIMVSCMEDSKTHPDFEGFKNVGSMQLYATGEGLWRFYKIVRKLFVYIINVIWPLLPFHYKLARILPLDVRGELLAIENADIVVSMGGGYIIGSKSLLESMSMLFRILPLRLAERLGKIVVLGPQSFGPFENYWQRRIVLKTLNASNLICVRENKSYEILKELGVKEELMLRTVDLGFVYVGNSRNYYENKDNKIRVGITARKWLKDDQQLNYEKTLARLIVDLQKKYNAEVILIPQVTSNYQADDDRIINKRINAFAVEAGAYPIKLMDEISLPDIKKLYSTLTFTIATRFHSAIFSLTSYVPVIAIEYEHKTSGIMHDLGLDDWSIPIEDVTTEKLNKLFTQLVSDRENYIKHLKNVLPDYIKKADEVPMLIRKIYERKTNKL